MGGGTPGLEGQFSENVRRFLNKLLVSMVNTVQYVSVSLCADTAIGHICMNPAEFEQVTTSTPFGTQYKCNGSIKIKQCVLHCGIFVFNHELYHVTVERVLMALDYWCGIFVFVNGYS